MSERRKPIFSAAPMGMVSLLQELGDFGALGEIAARDVMAKHVLAKFVEAAFVRFFVDAVNGLLILAHQPCCHRLVGEQHIFLD